MIPQNFLNDLLARADIVEVVDRHVPLKRAGANYKACCPFHGEKTPSFTVSPSKQFYHCFGCGAHGNAIGFLMEYRGLDFVAAVSDLASSLGLEVPRDDASRPRDEEGPGVLQALEQAARFYRDQLKRSDRAIAYLKNRGVSGEAAARFGLGYAPAEWQGLARCFGDYGDKVLEAAGLVIRSEEGRRYDRFRDRVMFPIADQRGAIIGFGGRVIGDGEPKYLNSPETSVFEKGRELYGVLQARRAIRDASCVLVVEGYMDVVALAQHGIDYAVATLGTATSPRQVQKLLRHADRVVFCFDGDEAGRKAAWRALESSLAQIVDGKRIEFLFLPHGEDPDSLVRKQGRSGFEELLAGATPLSTLLLQGLSSAVDLSSDEGRAKLLQDAKPMISQITAPAMSVMLRRRLAELARVSDLDLRELLGTPRSIGPPSLPAPRKDRQRGAVSLYRKLARVLLFDPALAAGVDTVLLETRDREALAVIALLDFIGRHRNVSAAAVVAQAEARFRGTEIEAFLQAAAHDILDWEDGFDVAAELRGILDQLRAGLVGRRLEELRRKPLSNLSEAERLEIRELLARQPGRASDGPGNGVAEV